MAKYPSANVISTAPNLLKHKHPVQLRLCSHVETLGTETSILKAGVEADRRSPPFWRDPSGTSQVPPPLEDIFQVQFGKHVPKKLDGLGHKDNTAGGTSNLSMQIGCLKV